MSQQPTFGRRAAPPQPVKRSAARPAAKAAELDLSSHVWGDDTELRAWKGQRRQAMSRAMGWRRWAFMAAIVLGAVIRWLAHGAALEWLGMGVSAVGFICLWAGRKRYADSLQP